MTPAQRELAEFRRYRLELQRQRALAPLTLAELRQAYDEANKSIPLPPGCALEPIVAPGVTGERLAPAGAKIGRALLYHHGGGHCIGSQESHRHLVARLAQAAGMIGFNMSYRLAPEHPFPAGLDDALANYQWLLGEGFAPEDIVVAGDSAGGNLTAALVVKLRQLGIHRPLGVYLLSPWLDLTHTRASHVAMADADVVLSRDFLESCAAAYCPGGREREHPLISPCFADLAGFPPVFIQVGGDEILLSDAVDFSGRAGFAGVDVTLRVWPGLVHGWPIFHEALSHSALPAIEEAGAWMRQRFDVRRDG